mgnify:CR=1 FL=1
MAHALLQFTVESYAKWKPVFDAKEDLRAQAGVLGTQIFRSGNNPREVFVLLEWEELEKARVFYASPEFKQAMEEAGVNGEPNINFLHEV